MLLTRDQVQQIAGDADRWLEPLNAALGKWYIDTPERVAMYLAQCAHESGAFKHLVENLHYSAAALLATWPRRFTADEAVRMAYNEEAIAERAYGGRMGNGPEGSGDGYRYRGRGIIQLTGRDNYRRCGKALGVDLEAHPELVEQPALAAQSAGWFWSTNGCDALADAGDFEGITRRINGGLNGLADRQAWLAKVRGILGAAPETAKPPQIIPQSIPVPPAPIRRAPATEDRMPILASLLPMILGMFAPRAQAAIGKATGADPQIAAQFTTDLFGKLGQLVNVPVKDDASAVQAVAALQAKAAAGDTAIVQQLEDHSLDYLDKLAPIVEKLLAQEQARWQAEDDSADKAATRGQKDRVDIGPQLSRWAMYIFALTALVIGAVLVAQVLTDPTHKVDGLLMGLLTILVYAAARIAESPFRYRFGGTPESQTIETGNVIVRGAAAQRTNGGT